MNSKDYTTFVDFDKVRAESLARIDSLVTQWLQGERKGHEFHAINPTRNDSKPGSFNINLDTGVWDDFADASIDPKLKANPVGLYAYLQNISWAEAAHVLAEQFGIAPEMPSPFQSHYRLGKPSQVWKYSNEFYVYRFETKKNGKEFRPVSWDGKKWQWRGPKGQLPLYRLNQIESKADASIVICEGEKAADAAVRFFPDSVTTTTAHGSKSPHRADFTPLEGRSILVWPDNDAAGKKYAQKVAQLALKAGATDAHILQIPESLPAKWDAADAKDENILEWERAKVKPHTSKWQRAVQSLDTGFNLETAERKVTGFPATDLGNAERFVLWNGDKVKYCVLEKLWYVWDGKHWKQDEKKHIETLGASAVRRILVEASDPSLNKLERDDLIKHARLSENITRINAMLSLSHCMTAVHLNDFDTHPMLFNVANGTVDLTTGKLLPHEPAALHSKISDIAYDPNAKCPNWLKFIDWVFQGDKETELFIQKAIGYSLTGKIDEQCLFVLHGDGSNGKSTFIDIINKLLGDYGAVAAPEILVKRRAEQHPTEIAGLKGKRFVAVNETEKGRSLDENRVKMVTGEEKITSRFMRGDFFTFIQEYSFWLSTNNRPNIKGTDKGIWRRIRLVPFDNTIDDKLIDKQLREKLTQEICGILIWAIEGCLKWQREGLGMPSAMKWAVDEYRNEQDALGRFIDERCELKADARAKTTELYKAYQAWCDENGERAENTAEFGKSIKKRGFKQHRGSKGMRFYLGISLVDPTKDFFQDQPLDSGQESVPKRSEYRNIDDVLSDPEVPTLLKVLAESSEDTTVFTQDQLKLRDHLRVVWQDESIKDLNGVLDSMDELFIPDSMFAEVTAKACAASEGMTKKDFVESLVGEIGNIK